MNDLRLAQIFVCFTELHETTLTESCASRVIVITGCMVPGPRGVKFDNPTRQLCVQSSISVTLHDVEQRRVEKGGGREGARLIPGH